LYGGDAHTLSNLYDIPIDEANETIAMYYDMFPEVLEYKLQTQQFAEDHGYIESPFGRREYLSHINDRSAENLQNKDRRVAVNMPVQSAASDILLAAMICLDKRLHEENMHSLLVNTVHDSLVADCPRFEIVKYAMMCADIMQNVVQYSVKYLPRLDFTWLKCPLEADVEVGTHYGAEIPIREWIERYGTDNEKHIFFAR
jgi:DNA polymerase-1